MDSARSFESVRNIPRLGLPMLLLAIPILPFAIYLFCQAEQRGGDERFILGGIGEQRRQPAGGDHSHGRAEFGLDAR